MKRVGTWKHDCKYLKKQSPFTSCSITHVNLFPLKKKSKTTYKLCIITLVLLLLYFSYILCMLDLFWHKKSYPDTKQQQRKSRLKIIWWWFPNFWNYLQLVQIHSKYIVQIHSNNIWQELPLFNCPYSITLGWHNFL